MVLISFAELMSKDAGQFHCQLKLQIWMYSKFIQKIENGEYKVWLLIVPQEFKKSTIKNDKVLTDQMVITGRKIPLSTI